MKFKRIATIITSFSMITSTITISQSVLAYDTTTSPEVNSNDRADYVYSYIGVSPSSKDLSEVTFSDLTQTNISDFSWNEGDYVWVGVTLTKMDRVVDLFSGEAFGLERNGLSDITAGLLYDDRYYTFEDDIAGDTYTIIKDTITAGDYYIKGEVYDYEADREDGTTVHMTAKGSDAESHIKVAKLTLEDSNATATKDQGRIFSWESDEDIDTNNEYLIFAFALQMTSVEPPSGTLALQGYMDTDTGQVDIGWGRENTMGVSFSSGIDDEEYDMGAYFNIKNTKIELPYHGSKNAQIPFDVKPGIAIYDKNEEGINHQDGNFRESRTFTYTNNDSGNLSKVYCDGILLVEDTDYKRTVIKNSSNQETGLTIVLQKEFMDSLSVGDHTVTFEPTNTADFLSKDVTLTIEQTVNVEQEQNNNSIAGSSSSGSGGGTGSGDTSTPSDPNKAAEGQNGSQATGTDNGGKDGEWWFTDVPKDSWFYDSVKYTYDNGLMYGVTEDTFGPQTDVTRAMFVTVLYRMEGEPNAEIDYSFKDIEKGGYYEKAVAWGSANDIIAGYSEDKFAPNDTITREQMAAILWRYAKYKGQDVTTDENTDFNGFADTSSITEYAIPAMKWAQKAKIINGFEDNTLRPLSNATRAQTSVVLGQFYRDYK